MDRIVCKHAFTAIQPRLHMHFFKNNSLFFKLMVTMCLALCPPILLSHLANSYFVSRYGFDEAGKLAANVVQLAAESAPVIEGMQSPSASARRDMADFLHMLTAVSGVRFIVLVDMKGIRLYHPDAHKIGLHVVGGDEGPALRGETYISAASGTLGFSQRAWRPVFNQHGQQIGAALVGVMSSDIERNIAQLTRPMTFLFCLALLIGIISAALLSRRIKKILFGLEPHQIARLLEERNALLSTVREGIVAVNAEGNIVVVNEMAEKILRAAGVQGELLGKPVQDTVPSTRLDLTLRHGMSEYDQEQSINGLSIITSRAPVVLQGKVIGAVATFRDMTEVRAQAELLTGLSNYVEALRARSHEYLNKLHVISGLLENERYDDLKKYLAEIIGSKVRETLSIAANVRDPIVAGFLESKLSRARELNVSLLITGQGIIPRLTPRGFHALVTICGNLIDNAFDAVLHTGRNQISLSIESDKKFLTVRVADAGRGIADSDLTHLFTKGFSTKGSGRGLGLSLVLLTLDELDGTVEVNSAVGSGSAFSVRIPLQSIAEVEELTALNNATTPRNTPKDTG